VRATNVKSTGFDFDAGGPLGATSGFTDDDTPHENVSSSIQSRCRSSSDSPGIPSIWRK
jgi:hypothetical protein